MAQQPRNGPHSGQSGPEPSETGTTRSSERRPDLARRRGEQLLIGRLTGHGRANYQFRSDEDASYYIKLLTSRGPRTLWGKDLERALMEAETKPGMGDLVGARRAAREAVTVTVKERDAEGRVVSQRERHAHRSLWIVEKVGFFAERARLARRVRDEQIAVREAVRTHPELRSAFLSVRAAEEFAARKIQNPGDRARFMELIKGAMAGSIQNGEPLPTVKLKTPAKASSPTAKPPPEKSQDEPTR